MEQFVQVYRQQFERFLRLSLHLYCLCPQTCPPDRLHDYPPLRLASAVRLVRCLMRCYRHFPKTACVLVLDCLGYLQSAYRLGVQPDARYLCCLKAVFQQVFQLFLLVLAVRFLWVSPVVVQAGCSTALIVAYYREPRSKLSWVLIILQSYQQKIQAV